MVLDAMVLITETAPTVYKCPSNVPPAAIETALLLAITVPLHSSTRQPSIWHPGYPNTHCYAITQNYFSSSSSCAAATKTLTSERLHTARRHLPPTSNWLLHIPHKGLFQMQPYDSGL
jgi:hypothetical protein